MVKAVFFDGLLSPAWNRSVPVTARHMPSMALTVAGSTSESASAAHLHLHGVLVTVGS